MNRAATLPELGPRAGGGGGGGGANVLIVRRPHAELMVELKSNGATIQFVQSRLVESRAQQEIRSALGGWRYGALLSLATSPL